MPCYDGGSHDYERGYSSGRSEVRELEKTIEKFEAVLCGIMQLDPSIVDRIDWKEVGITKQQHLNWWKEHQKEDAARKKREKLRKEKAAAEREARKEKLRKELAKLEAEDVKKAKKKAAKRK